MTTEQISYLTRPLSGASWTQRRLGPVSSRFEKRGHPANRDWRAGAAFTTVRSGNSDRTLKSVDSALQRRRGAADAYRATRRVTRLAPAAWTGNSTSMNARVRFGVG